MAQRFYLPREQVFTNLGAVGAGWKLETFETGTTTPKVTYSDTALTTPNTNPLIADSNGRFGDIFVDDLADYKAVLKDVDDNTIWTTDPVDPKVFTLNDFDPRPTSFWGTTAGSSTVYTLAANPTLTSYSSTNTFYAQIHTTCGNTPNINIDSLGAITIKKYNNEGSVIDIIAGDLVGGQAHEFRNDGTNIICLNPRTRGWLGINKLTLADQGELTISSGEITVTGSNHTIDGEGDAADSLVTINGGVDGMVVDFQIENASRKITFSHNSGNILCENNQDIAVANTDWIVRCKYRSSDSKWLCWVVNNKAVDLIEVVTVASGLPTGTISIGSEYSTISIEIERMIPSSNNTWIGLQYSTNGGSSWIGSNYESLSNAQTLGALNPVGYSTVTTAIQISSADTGGSRAVSSTASYGGLRGNIFISNPSDANRYKAAWGHTAYEDASNNFSNVSFSGVYTGAVTAINLFRLAPSAGTLTGVMRIYGYK